jgi:hypothetical protein
LSDDEFDENQSQEAHQKARAEQTLIFETLQPTADQIRIWELIESRPEGVSVAQICDELSLSLAKVQGDLGAITNKARNAVGPDFTILNKVGGLYFPTSKAISAAETPTNTKDYHERIQKIRSVHPNAYSPWNEEDEQQLTELWNDGAAPEEISKVMGRQIGGIKSRLRRLGLLDAESSRNRPFSSPKDADGDIDESLIIVEDEISSSVPTVVEDDSSTSVSKCTDCGEIIPIGRLEAVPGATKCVNCAASEPFEKKKIQETWGTREDYKKDRRSWAPWRRK